MSITLALRGTFATLPLRKSPSSKRCAKKSVNRNRKNLVFAGQLALALLMAILCYLIAMTILGPILR